MGAMELSDTRIILKPWQLRHILEEAVEKGIALRGANQHSGEMIDLAVKELFDLTVNGTS